MESDVFFSFFCHNGTWNVTLLKKLERTSLAAATTLIYARAIMPMNQTAQNLCVGATVPMYQIACHLCLWSNKANASDDMPLVWRSNGTNALDGMPLVCGSDKANEVNGMLLVCIAINVLIHPLLND